MRYSRRTSVVSPGVALTLVVVVGVVFVLFLIRIFFPGALSALMSPFWRAGNYAALEVGDFQSGASIRAERDQLLIESETLRNENATLRARLKDAGVNDALPEDTGIALGVIARPPMAPYDALIIETPPAGLPVGTVIFSHGVPVGTVADSGQGTARVALYSANGQQHEGWLGEERVPITVVGKGAGAFEVEVSKELPVLVGDIVYLPGPGAFPVGTVREVESHPSSPSARLIIEPLANPFTMSMVRAVLP